MKLKAKDQLHISSVRADSLRPGEEFEVSDPIGRDLVKRGLATKVSGPKKGASSKKAQAADNKKAPSPDNKAG